MGGVMSYVLPFLPWRVRQRYWKRVQCPGTKPDGMRCTRKHHGDQWHRDGRGHEWRD